jgi:DNA polymerase III, delta subunit
MEHHAYFHEGPLALLPVLSADSAERFGLARGVPDLHTQEWQKFGIDDARELGQQATLKSTTGHALFVLGIGAITIEAQQALLKLFEEPQQGTIFVLLVPHGVLLPTVRSRFIPYPELAEKNRADSSVKGSVGNEAASEAKEFLSWPYKQRSDWVSAFVKKDDDAVRERARNFLNALEVDLYGRFSARASMIAPKELSLTQDIREGLQDIGHFRQYLADRSPSLKMILEHFAATLPILPL